MPGKKRLTAALAATALMLSATALARDLTVVSWGGAYQDAQREVYFKPFMEKTRIVMAEDNWDGGVGTLRAKIQGGSNNWDVVQVESDELLLGCEEGLYEKLDWAKLGGKDRFLPDAVNDCGVGAIVYSFILAYDGDRIKGDTPKSWVDFWNVKKWPGKRALRKGAKTTLEIALMADGVAAQRRVQSPRDQRGRGPRVQRGSPSSSPTWCGGKRARSHRNCSPRGKWR